MAGTLLGPCGWSGMRDDEGHRSFDVKFKVRALLNDGPYTVMATPGLPLTGSAYSIGNDTDIWAICQPGMKVSPMVKTDAEERRFWYVMQTFSTKPFPTQRCSDISIEDPLLEPPRVSGGSSSFTREAIIDRNGNPIKTSSHEPIRGSVVEKDVGKMYVEFSINTADLELGLMAQLLHHLNDGPMWGLSSRCIKFSSVTWERILYGVCGFYYKRNLRFDIDFETFDTQALDEGNRVLNGHWDPDLPSWILDDIDGSPPDPDNPAHFIQYKDRKGENSRCILDGAGKPATSSSGFNIDCEKYPETNLFILGIPATF